MGNSGSTVGSDGPSVGSKFNANDDSMEHITVDDMAGVTLDYENLVLEGGGAKTFAFTAALEVLSDVGVLQNIRRIAGASGGAVAGALLAVGYSPTEIQDKFQQTMGYVSDASFGVLSLLPNIVRRFGWHPGDKALAALEDAIGEKTGDRKLTFSELYRTRNIELCIVATNITAMTPEYFHPKTTPDVTIAEAVRMSISIPCFMAPYKLRSADGTDNYFVDGGVLCNYPIHVFDGWFLSMDRKDTFFQKLGGDEPPFGTYNDKTLGLVVYAADEVDVMKLSVHGRTEKGLRIKRPSTKLSRERGKKIDEAMARVDRKATVLRAARTVMEQFRKYDRDDSSTISMDELNDLITKADPETREALGTLFGANFTFDVISKEVDKDGNGEISFAEFVNYLERKENIGFNEFAKGVATLEISTLAQFISGIINTWQVNNASNLLGAHAINRTIGVFTDYIKALDVHMEQQDLEYLHKLGKIATVAFLRERVQEMERTQSG